MIDKQRDPLELDPVILLTENVARLVEQVSALVEQVSALVEQLGGAPTPRLMSCEQVAELFGVSEDWVRNAARTQRIPCRRIGSKYRFTQADVDEAIESARRCGRDPYALSARQVAAIERGRRQRLAGGSGRVEPVPGRDFTDAPFAVIFCPGVGSVVTGDNRVDGEMGSSFGYFSCPHCGRPARARSRTDEPTVNRIGKHSLRISRDELQPEHKPWNRNQPYSFGP